MGPVQGGLEPLDVFDHYMNSIPDDEEWYARHAAMIEVESGWTVRAESPWAQGWSQFTPPTRGDWWPRVPGCAERVETDPYDMRCSVLAMNLYMEWLYQRSRRLTHDHGTALRIARAGYNGGLGWQLRQYRLCLATPGCDPNNWQHLAALCREAGRSAAACRENNAYPEKIARAEPRYYERKQKRKLLGRILKIGLKAAVAVSPSPVGIGDVQRVRKAVRSMRGEEK